MTECCNGCACHAAQKKTPPLGEADFATVFSSVLLGMAIVAGYFVWLGISNFQYWSKAPIFEAVGVGGFLVVLAAGAVYLAWMSFVLLLEAYGYTISWDRPQGRRVKGKDSADREAVK